MKVGMNLLLWTTDLTEAQFPLLRQLAEVGYDGVEVPIFRQDAIHFAAIRRALDDASLAATAVTVLPPEANPIDPDPAVRRAAVETLRGAIEMASILGAEVLCGPIHSPVGCRAGR